MTLIDNDPIFTDNSPRNDKALEKLREEYRKAHGRELPNSVELAMNAEEREES